MDYRHLQLSTLKAVPAAQGPSSEDGQALAGGHKGTVKPGEGGQETTKERGPRVSGQNTNSISYNKHLLQLV